MSRRGPGACGGMDPSCLWGLRQWRSTPQVKVWYCMEFFVWLGHNGLWKRILVHSFQEKVMGLKTQVFSYIYYIHSIFLLTFRPPFNI